ncbi:MAG: hypothetical protein ACRCUM_02700, partial [Mycoplasmoidaceae bacterium]
MSKKKKYTSGISITIYRNAPDKKLGYKGYNKSELIKYWKTLAKHERVYGNMREANLLDKYVKRLPELIRTGEVNKIRRMIKRTSHSRLNLEVEHSKGDYGNSVKYSVPKAPRDSKAMEKRRAKKKEIEKMLKNGEKLSASHIAFYMDNLIMMKNVISKDKLEYMDIVSNMFAKHGATAWTHYKQDLDRFAR